jgi:hypothetical protein
MRMAADRQHLVSAIAKNAPLKTVNMLDPETRDWVLTGALWGISSLRLPPFIKGLLRTAASISLRNRVAGLMHATKPH